MLPIITLDTMEASKDFREYYAMAVSECVKYRKKRQHTIEYLSSELAVTRQKLSKFEKLKIYDIALMDRYLEYYYMKLNLVIK